MGEAEDTQEGWPGVGAALHARKWKPGTENHGTQAVFLAFLSYLTAWVPYQALALWCEGSRRGPYATEHLFSWVPRVDTAAEVTPATAAFLRRRSD